MILVEIGIVLALIAINGFLALSELALVSARRSRLETMRRKGRRGARQALELMQRPGRFLSAVQIGITLIGIVAGAFSGVTIAERGDAFLERLGVPTTIAEPVAYVLVVAIITYLSVIAGELIPKQVALQKSERIAVFVAIPMQRITWLLGPLIAVLDASARFGLRLLGLPGRRIESVTDEEIKALVAEAERTGVVKPEERAMIAGVMRLADRSVQDVMTPRTELEWIDLAGSADATRRAVLGSRHSRLLAAEGADRPVGVIVVREVLGAMTQGGKIELARFLHKVPAVSERIGAVETLRHLRESSVDLVFVVDEHGTIGGIVTSADVVETVVSDVIETGRTGSRITRRPDGSYLIDGDMPIDELMELLSLPTPTERDYHTAAGMVLYELRRLPAVGDVLRHEGWQFEVIDLDGVRIDKLLVTSLNPLHRNF